MDSEGYPEQEELDYISDFDIIEQDVFDLIQYIKNRWCYNNHFVFFKRGYKTNLQKILERDPDNSRKDYYELRLHTGGWSGNEDIIKALQKNKYFFIFHWYKSERGGHYYFEITKEHKS